MSVSGDHDDGSSGGGAGDSTRSTHLQATKHKSYNMKVVHNDEVKLLLKGNRKW